jgi:O-antigen ligase
LFAVPLAESFSVSTFFSLLMILYPSLLLVLLYCVGKRIDITRKGPLFWTFFIISVILISAMFRYYGKGETEAERGAIADVYYILGLLPLMLACTKAKWRFVPVLVTTFAVIFSTKRTGLLALSVMMILYFVLAMIKERNLKKFAKILLLFALCAALFVGFFLYMDNTFEDMQLVDRLLRLSEDGGSGRDVRWKVTWESFCSSDLLHMVFGHGKGSIWDATLVGETHNDFLQVLYEHGFLAFLAYVGFYVALLAELVHMFRAKYPHAVLFAMSVICSLFLAMFSYYVIAPTYITCGILCYGFFLADFHKFQADEGMSE